MGLPPDEHLPEVVPHQPMPYPEVVPDSSPEAAQQRFYMEADKYPAPYDDAPKLLHEQQPAPGMLHPEQQYPPAWMGAGEMPMSATVSPLSSVPWQTFPPGDGGGDDQTFVGSEPEPEKRICGLRRRLFFIIAAIVALVVVGAAVGGGVGGSMAAKSKSSEPGSQAGGAGAGASNTTSVSSSGTSSTAPTATVATNSSSSTSSAPTPTITNLNDQTDPSAFDQVDFQGWVAHNFSGNATQVYKQPGFFDLPFAVTSYIWLPNTSGACITFCVNMTYSGGYRCGPYKQPAASGPFSRISIWFGDHSNTTLQDQCS